MALPTTISLLAPPFNFRTGGIVLSLVPSDPQLYVEVQRAPDNGSNQPNVGAAVSVISGLTLPAGGGLFRDNLPLDDQRRFYRARQHGAGYDPGPWTNWTAGFKPVPLKTDLLFTMMGGLGVPAILAPLRSVADNAVTEPEIAPLAVGEEQLITQAVQRRTLGAQTVSDLANLTSRNRFFNGDAEDLRSYWNSNPSGQGNTTLVVVNDADTISGTYSFKLTHSAAGNEYFHQSTYAGVEATDPANWAFFRVKPGSRVQVQYKYKVSGANVFSRITIAEYSSGGGNLAVTQIGTDGASPVPEFREIEYTVGPTTFYVVIRFGATGSGAGYVIYDELAFIDLIPFTDTVMDWKSLGLKTAAFQVDWQEGHSQYAEINGTNLAITLVNPEPGGRYRLYLKQNSQPDTVTWPANIKWRNNTTPVLSVVTGRIDRITLEWNGAVYLGDIESWWPETEQVISPAGNIPSSQAFGATIVDRPHINPTGMASAQAFGSTVVVRDDPVPIIVSSSAAWISGGDLCGAGGNFVVTVSWTTDDAPDVSYHITIDGTSCNVDPSVGSFTFDTGVGPQNLDPPHTELLTLGPYTVRLKKDSDNSDVDTDVTNAVNVDYQFGFCI